MPKQPTLDDEPIESDDDSDDSDWYQTESTKKFEAQLIAGVQHQLNQLVMLATDCKDPVVAQASGEYQAAKRALHALQCHGKRKPKADFVKPKVLAP